jgi:hypothetical protein
MPYCRRHASWAIPLGLRVDGEGDLILQTSERIMDGDCGGRKLILEAENYLIWFTLAKRMGCVAICLVLT